ncbi:pre-mrna-splicing factor slu7 [Gossypium australe]|uniref:Pre-mrna-splicing factor slu7 n=1 Tax=Gossypium australe TaxID=47621 RepID=A0A5B6VTX6_9ROSI|nr:pre-mrna-splicing factor slu7 [Gossypium australe]
MVASEYERCVKLEDCLRDNLRREREFMILIEKANIAEDVKRNRDHERGKNKRDSEPSISVQRPKKNAKSDGPFRVEAPVASTGILPCGDCGECGRVLKKDWSLFEMWVIRALHSGVQTSASGPVYSQRVVQQPPKGRGQARGGNGLGRGQRALGRGAGQIEVRQPALVYAAHHRENGDAPNVIIDTFFIFDVPYLALIDIGSTHSYIASTISETLGISVESTTSEVTILSLLG